MPRYRVTVGDSGESVLVDAPDESTAREKVRRDINTQLVKQAGQSYLDDVLFDYETGVQDAFFRQRLGRAETFEEREKVATNYVGDSGFLYNSRGQMALTPDGQRSLGIKPSFITLENGETVEKNVMIDENSFGIRDIADFSGAAGPIFGAIAALAPQGRLLKTLAKYQKVFGPRFQRTIAAGIGTAGGKAGEEVVDALAGFQEQDAKDIAELLGFEFALGATGQGVGEILGTGYQIMLGKKAPFDDLHLQRSMIQQYNPIDVMKLNRVLGREATDAELKRATTQPIQGVTVRKFQEGLLPSQKAFNRPLPARAQAMTEEILGNARNLPNVKFALRGMASLYEDLGLVNMQQVKLEEFLKRFRELGVSARERGAVARKIAEMKTELSSQEGKVINKLEKLVDDTMDAMVDEGIQYGPGGNLEGGALIRGALQEARDGVTNAMQRKYTNVDDIFFQLEDPITAIKLGELADVFFQKTKGMLSRYGAKEPQLAVRPELGEVAKLKTAPIAYLEQINNRLRRRALNITQATPDEVQAFADAGTPLKTIRDYFGDEGPAFDNAYSNFVKLTPTNQRLGLGPDNFADMKILPFSLENLRRELSTIAEEVKSFTQTNTMTKIMHNMKTDYQDIFKTFADPRLAAVKGLSKGFKQRTDAVSRLQAVRELFEIDSARVKKGVEELQEANEFAANVLKPFDKQRIVKAQNEAAFGAYDPENIYKNLILDGDSADLRAFFNALDNYDNYGTTVIGRTNKSNEVKKYITQRILNDAYREATSFGTDVMRFDVFANEISKFYRKFPNKASIVFGQNSDNFIRTIEQLNKLGPKVKADEVEKLILQFNKPREGQEIVGLGATQPGQQFLRGLSDLAEASAEKQKFEANLILNKLPEATNEELIGKIFTPQGSSNIKVIRQALGEGSDDFKALQANAMTRLLQKAIDFDGPTKSADITKILNASKFKTTLDSYGDETLEAMFGKEIQQGLRDYSRALDVMTKGERGTGGTSGTLIAAAIAINAYNPALWPTIVGAEVLRRVFMSPRFLKAMAKTDKSSVVEVLEYFDRAFRLSAVRGIASLTGDINDYVEKELQKQLEGTDLDERLIDEAGAVLPDIQRQGKELIRDVPTASIELPEISPIRGSELAKDPQIRSDFLVGSSPLV